MPIQVVDQEVVNAVECAAGEADTLKDHISIYCGIRQGIS